MRDHSEEFKRVFQSEIKRPGADKLLAWLESTDFFTAPASSRHHLAHPGGLVEHSINVYTWAKMLIEAHSYGIGAEFDAESVAIAALLHDICKVHYYEPTWKNQKTYDEGAVAAAPRYLVKHDQGGDFIWETVQGYIVNEQFTYGHGEKSVYLIQKHMELTDEEAVAIRFHMGSWQDGEKANASAAFKTNSLAFWLHVADEAATFLTEKEAEE